MKTCNCMQLQYSVMRWHGCTVRRLRFRYEESKNGYVIFLSYRTHHVMSIRITLSLGWISLLGSWNHSMLFQTSIADQTRWSWTANRPSVIRMHPPEKMHLWKMLSMTSNIQNLTSSWPDCEKYLWKFWFKSIQWFRSWHWAAVTSFIKACPLRRVKNGLVDTQTHPHTDAQ